MRPTPLRHWHSLVPIISIATLAFCMGIPRLAVAAEAGAPLGLTHKTMLSGHQGQISRVRFIPGTRNRLVSAGYDDKTVRLWDTLTGASLAQVDARFGPRDFVLPADGSAIEVLYNTGDLRTVPIITDTLDESRTHWGQAGTYGRLAQNRSGRFYAIASRNQDITVWNASTRRPHQSYAGTRDYSAVEFADGDSILAAADGHNSLAIWDIFANEGFGSKVRYQIIDITPDIGTWDLAFSSDGRKLATAHIDGHVTLWSLPNADTAATQTHTLRTPESAFSVVFSPDGTLLLASCQDGSVYAFDTRSGALVGRLEGGIGSLLSLALNTEGTLLAAGSLGGDIVLWAREP
jgi:WD40 repeat protein